MRLVYICSPLRGDMEKNIERAHEYCAYAAECGMIPLAPHTIFTKYLDDQRPEQRERGLTMGLELLKRCDEIWVCGSTISQGMKGEIDLAAEKNIPTLYIPDSFVRIGYKIRQDDKPFTREHCVSGSEKESYENQILVLDPAAHDSGPMTADDSLWVAEDGFGRFPRARGQAVYARNLLDNRLIHWERHDFLGIVDPLHFVGWISDKPVRNKIAFELVEQANADLTAEQPLYQGEDLEP